MLTAVIDAPEERDMMTCDIPNAFIQALMPKEKDRDERVMMKITGVLVGMLVELNPELYGPYVVYEKRKVLYVQVMRAIYGMLEAAILWYKKFRGELEQKGFKFNPYDPCVANRTERGSQHTLLFHVACLKSSHKDSKVNDQFDKWLQDNYGEHGEVAIHRGKKRDYLGMELDFSKKGKVKIGMCMEVDERWEKGKITQWSTLEERKEKFLFAFITSSHPKKEPAKYPNYKRGMYKVKRHSIHETGNAAIPSSTDGDWFSDGDATVELDV
jgi:hypothetical protein